ncbi:hypothetical protein M1B34_11700 [Pseudomonas sp. MAFF 302030]|jgi:hypothetical protein|uniref:Uncharacterized protein n=1 Tax=Pseudomonas morbosilactucae TaxID=2938197 RepID=A0A9X1YVI9_9PSED|nr:hypothetical protein [Pseudomonas morbosilactucae]MCK9798371.1 hypothetical protein [Pseudomonas morbosilactucae]MCK9812857.1 hypothetical protein [Pseudomonas morbosilactucae]
MIKLLPKSELQALAAAAEENTLTLSDLGGICERYAIDPRQLLNELSVEVAEGFLAGALSYGFCDGVMNGVVGAIVNLGMVGDFPEPAFSLYHAFDQGEWVRSSDPVGTDPGEQYTRPIVMEIMRNLEG